MAVSRSAVNAIYRHEIQASRSGATEFVKNIPRNMRVMLQKPCIRTKMAKPMENFD